MIIKIPTNKLFFNNTWLQLVVVFTLIFLSYGGVWTRGGYADDFILLANSVQGDLLDSAKTWGNSRFASSITNWLVVRLLNNETLPADFAWTTIHSISFFSFALGAYFLNASLSVFRLGIEARWIAVLIFILHPIKNQALLWPCAVFIYNVPFTIFLAATYYYLTKASSKNESIWASLICFLAWLYSALSLEQFIPMLFVVVAIRMLFLPRTNRDVITTSAILLVITFIFAVSVMAGKTASRLENFSLSDGDRFSHMVNTLMTIFSAYFIYPLKSALDPLFWHQFFNASVAVELVIGSLLLIWIAVFFIQKKECSDSLQWHRALVICCVGLVLFIAPLSPFFITRYYLPERVFFIPLLGLGISIGTLLAYIIDVLKIVWLKYAVILGIVFSLWLFLVGNIFTQREFASYWKIEQSLIQTLLEEHPKSDTTVYIFGAPRTIRSTPSLIDEFTFPGLVKWMFPGVKLDASSVEDIGHIFHLPNDPTVAASNSFVPTLKNNLLLLWANNRWQRIDEITLKSETNHGLWKPYIAQLSVPATSYAVKPKVAYIAEDLDTMLLCIQIPSSRINKSTRLILHVKYSNGMQLPYDETLLSNEETDMEQRHCLVVHDVSKIEEIFLASNYVDQNSAATPRVVGADFIPKTPFKFILKH